MRHPWPLALSLLFTLLAARTAHAGWLGPAGLPVAHSAHGYPVALTSDGSGGVLVAFHGADPASATMRVQRVLADGTIAPGWSAEGTLACSTSAAGTMSLFQSVSDGAGGMFLLWSTGNIYLPGPPRLQHVLANGQIAAGWPLAGRALVASNPITYAHMLPDGSGGVVVSWSQGTTLRTLRVLGNGSNAPGSVATGRIVMSASSGGNLQPGRMTASPTLGGYWIAAALTSADTLTTPAGIWLLHLLSNGALDAAYGNGGSTEVPVAASAQVFYPPTTADDGSGGAFVYSPLAGRASVAHVDASAAPDASWPSVWLDLGAAGALHYLHADLQTDGVGGLWVVWGRDPLGGYGGSLRRIHIDGTYDPVWPAATEITNGTFSHLVANASGAFTSGMHIWDCPHQNCFGTSAVAYRTSAGSIPPGWPQSPFSTSQSGEYPLPDSSIGAPPDMVPDGTGGVFVAWVAPDTARGAIGSTGTVRVARFTGSGAVTAVDASPPPMRLRARGSAAGIRLQWDDSEDARRVQILDVLGRRMLSVVPPAGRLQDWLVPGSEALPAGLYLVRVHAHDRELHAKVVMTH